MNDVREAVEKAPAADTCLITRRGPLSKAEEGTTPWGKEEKEAKREGGCIARMRTAICFSSSKDVVVALIFLSTFILYLERQGFSIAFTILAKENGLDEKTKGSVLSAFFYGYAAMQVPGGWLSARYGGKLVLIVAFAMWATVSFATPGGPRDAGGAEPDDILRAATGSDGVFARLFEALTRMVSGGGRAGSAQHVELAATDVTLLNAAESAALVRTLIICRVLVGASQGLVIPASHTVLARWVAKTERSRLVSLAMSGMYIGSALAMAAVPPLVSDMGPSAQFRAVGVVGMVWLPLWIYCGGNGPPLPGSSGGGGSGGGGNGDLGSGGGSGGNDVNVGSGLDGGGAPLDVAATLEAYRLTGKSGRVSPADVEQGIGGRSGGICGSCGSSVGGGGGGPGASCDASQGPHGGSSGVGGASSAVGNGWVGGAGSAGSGGGAAGTATATGTVLLQRTGSGVTSSANSSGSCCSSGDGAVPGAGVLGIGSHAAAHYAERARLLSSGYSRCGALTDADGGSGHVHGRSHSGGGGIGAGGASVLSGGLGGGASCGPGSAAAAAACATVVAAADERLRGGIPWKRLLSSHAVIAILASNFAFHCGVYVVMNWLPTYFAEYLSVDLLTLGPVKMLPHLSMFFFSNIGGFCSDWLVGARGWTVRRSRKAVNALGLCLAAASLVGMASAGGTFAGVAWSTATLSALGLSRGGWSVNHMDIAPRFAGVVMAIANAAGTLAGVLGVWVTGVVLADAGGSKEPAGWAAAFGLVASVCVGAAAFFAAFAQGEVLFT